MEVREELEYVREGYGDEEPTAYDESADPNKFWGPDLYDHAMPKRRGFLTDLIYTMRGTEVPTLFTLWSGLWLLSTAIKREAWLSWFPVDLYPNLYVILAGPAGSKKSTTIDDVGMPILEVVQQYISHPNIRRMKNIHTVKDKMTPEAMLDAMLPGNKKGKSSFVLVDSDGKPLTDSQNRPLRYKATSEMGIVLSEMTSSIGKRSYTEGFVEVLLDLYNPKDHWEWRTKGEGTKVFRNTYLSLLAATTPVAFRESVPKVAAGDGFLSRCVVVYQAISNRRFSVPRPVPAAPNRVELAKRLAWIAEHGLGEFRLSEEAFSLYDDWYDDYKNFMDDNEGEGGLRGRMYLNLLKTALLLRLQRYSIEPQGIVEECDMADAIQLMHVTYGLSSELLGELGDAVRQGAERVMRVLSKYKKLRRTDLLRKTHIQVDEFNEIIDYLVQVGSITIMLEGRQKTYPSKNGGEIYTITDLQEKETNAIMKEKEVKRRNTHERKTGEGKEEVGEAANDEEDTDREDEGSLPQVRDDQEGGESSTDESRHIDALAEEAWNSHSRQK